MSCGIVHCGGGGAAWVTVTVVVGTRQSPGAELGLVVCPLTTFVSLPEAGLKAPVNPAPVHADRAWATVRPVKVGT